MATHSSVLAWRIPGIGEPGGLPSMGSHRVGHDWSDLAAVAAEKPENLSGRGFRLDLWLPSPDLDLGSVLCQSCFWILELQTNSLTSSVVGFSRILNPPKDHSEHSCFQSSALYYQTTSSSDRRSIWKAAILYQDGFKFCITSARRKPLVDVSEQIEAFTQDDLMCKMSSVLGTVRLITAFLNFVFRFHVNTLCHIAKRRF